ncbi:MAG: nucleoside hydrolase [Chloroflexota bacterium]|nr:nucleoside hydrolase [Chloroflexota bacterium]
MRKVILDMDPGIDDALALVLALRSPELKILGVSTVAGNAPLDMTSANARRVLEHLGATGIPVAAGAAKPLEHALVDATQYHGPDGLGQCLLPPPHFPLHPAKVWDFLAELISNRPGEITLVATGPLTNIALAFQHYPQLPKSLASLVIMGGAFGLTPYGKKGNTTPVAEFNTWQDPEAASIVLAAGVDTFVTGLDVTTDPRACLNRGHLKQINSRHTAHADLAARLIEYVLKRHELCELHDPLALTSLLDISLFDFMSAQVEIGTGNGWKRGMTHVLPPGKKDDMPPPVHIASGIDGARFLKLFLSRILEE